MKMIRWGWILLGGFLAELTVFAVAIPLALLVGQESLLYIAQPASLAASFAFGLWVAKKAPRHRVLHGALVGVLAMLIYIGMSRGRPVPISYAIAHVLKVVGGAAGGFVALKRPAAGSRPTRDQA
jgi:putative membrane protein (TIGR04086 family)